jgi:DNA polymerase III epsilon subunit-like protein
MQRIENFKKRTRLFIFDLEFIGDVRNLHTCHIWEIAVYSVMRDSWFSKVVDPDKNMQVFPKPPIPEIPHLKRAFLEQEKAVTWDNVFMELCEWVSQEVTIGVIPVFISHNTFRADKPIMELECKRYKMVLPSNWYFFDSLHYSRDVIQNSSNYSLSGLHENIFNESIQNVHRARSDVTACLRILIFLTKSSWDLQGPMYPAYFTSLRSIRWIGRKTENLLTAVGVDSAESLFMILQKNIHRNYIEQGIDDHTSIETTLKCLLTGLPVENIQNITNVLMEMRTEKPFSFTFMLKAE